MATIRHRRRLGRELEQIRSERGLSQRDVADALGWSAPTVGRIEQAKTKDIRDHVEQLLALYEVDGERRQRLLQLATGSTAAGWWTAYNDVVSTVFAGLEDEADAIRTWQDSVVPGLLQVEDYARAVIAAVARTTGDPPQIIQRRVEARMHRRVLLDRANPPRLHAIIDEAVLHRPYGGREVMREQISHLLKSAQREHVTIQITPFGCNAHAGLEGRFTILSFDGDPDVPYIESQAGATYLEAPGEIERVNVTWGCVSDAALSVDQSLELLARLEKEV